MNKCFIYNLCVKYKGSRQLHKITRIWSIYSILSTPFQSNISSTALDSGRYDNICEAKSQGLVIRIALSPGLIYIDFHQDIGEVEEAILVKHSSKVMH